MASTEPVRWRLAREAQLLLATSGGADQDDRIRSLVGDRFNWTLLLQLTALERAEAVVAARLNHVGAKLPEDVARQLKAMALRSDLRMTTISHRLDRTLQALDAAGIEVILLKGAALGRTVYGSLARRPMLDVDLLIHAPDAVAANSTVLELGWVASETDRASDHYSGHFHLPPYTDGIGLGFNLELHTGLFVAGHPFEWPLEDVWTRKRRLPNGPGSIPSPEDLLLHVALHFSWSHMTRVGTWRAFRDVFMLAESGTVDWNAFLNLTTRSRGAPAVYWTFRLARRFGVSVIPQEVESALRPPSLGERTARALERHFSGQWYMLDAPCPSTRLERLLWIRAMGSLGKERDHAMPWARELVFPDLWNASLVETGPSRLFRHLTNMGSYARYFRRVFLGSPARQHSPTAL